jgi:hypothetical protein
MRTAGRRGKPDPRMPARGEGPPLAGVGPEAGTNTHRHGKPRNDDGLLLLARATVAVVLVSAALARHLGMAAVDAARAALGRPRTAPAAGTALEETVARAVRALL